MERLMIGQLSMFHEIRNHHACRSTDTCNTVYDDLNKEDNYVCFFQCLFDKLNAFVKMQAYIESLLILPGNILIQRNQVCRM